MEINGLKVVLAQLLMQTTLSLMSFLFQDSLHDGLSAFALVTYKLVIASITMAPFAFFLEREKRPHMTVLLFARVFFLALLGLSGSQILYMVGFSYAGSIFASAILNLIPGITFVIGVLMRIEKVDLCTCKGNAKLFGTVASVGGAMVMTLYKGPVLGSFRTYHEIPNKSNLTMGAVLNGSNLTIGAVFIVSSTIMIALWMVFQTNLVKDYPALISLTSIQCGLGAMQSLLLSAIFGVISKDGWSLGFTMKLVTCIYSGILGSAISHWLDNWCIKEVGGVFVAMFSPLNVVIILIFECALFHYALHLGSLVGAVITVMGLYLFLLGMSKGSKVCAVVNRDSVRPLLENGGVQV